MLLIFISFFSPLPPSPSPPLPLSLSLSSSLYLALPPFWPLSLSISLTSPTEAKFSQKYLGLTGTTTLTDKDTSISETQAKTVCLFY